MNEFHLSLDDVYQVDGPVNLVRLMSISDMVNRPDLTYPAFTPRIPKQLVHSNNIFEVASRQDLLLHLPFESYSPVIDMVQQAASDPQVVGIKITLYRSGADSILVDLLVGAAKAGKEVTAIVELLARFDEEANIKLATRLQQAGVQVVYGVVGFKTHAKMLLVVRRENEKLRYTVHMGTGNYHSKTARLYTDFGLITSDQTIGNDVHRLFLQLTGLSKKTPLSQLLQSPFTLLPNLLKFIKRETDFALKGKSARIIAKMNSLTHREVIEALYEASRAGVQIDLIVRGVCCLRPAIPEVSENIRVRSVVGRFLEHSRIYCFYNDGKEEVWLSSADWMERNLNSRVEVCFPIKHPDLKKRIIEEGLEPYLNDNCSAWKLLPDGEYERLHPGDEIPFMAQEALMNKMKSQ
jgi:polyphosphate kinase